MEKIIRSSEKCQKFWSTDYENFDQLIKHNFDQLNFGQTIPCHSFHKSVQNCIKMVSSIGTNMTFQMTTFLTFKVC